ncbi:MAG TPA: ATP-binding protein [Anaeromyxobacteraceae bacterium]|nr:ATP-binding protein [Anaeromyxobacteraceae bacterium]
MSLARCTELYDFAPVGYATLDGKGTVLEINLVGATMLGKERARVIGQRFAVAVTPATRPAFQAFLDTLRETEKVTCDVALAGPGGRDLYVHIAGVREHVDEGKNWRWRVAFTDTTDLKTAEDRLQESDRNKSQFLAMLSHELRNPLAPIRNGIYLLERAEAGSEQATRAKEIIRRQTEQLTRLVADLLDMTRISGGKIELQRSLIDLREIVRKTTDDLIPLFEQSEVELRVEPAAGPAWVDADGTRLAQVVGNLLLNAVKFTPVGGTVTVRVATTANSAELHVRDTGVGMASDQLGRLFQPFAQADTSLARTKGGLGLGLALVKGLVEAHGGSVRARSEGAGRGSEFVVTLPLSTRGAVVVEHPAPSPTASGRTILVIEDNVDAGQSLADVLELHGYRVRLARDARSGIALAREVRPDVVLCDIGLPDLDGYEVARTLRQDVSLESTRLIALSGYAQPEERERAKRAGFHAHVAKPASFDELWAALASKG